MSIWEKLGLKSAGQKKEEERERQITEKIKQILKIEEGIEELEENLRRGGDFPITRTVIEGQQKRIDDLNQEIVALGGKPVGSRKKETPPVPIETRPRPSFGRPLGPEGAKRVVEEAAEALAEKLSQEEQEERKPTKRDFGVIQGGKRNPAEGKK
jgi:hypothetical protein